MCLVLSLRLRLKSASREMSCCDSTVLVACDAEFCDKSSECCDDDFINGVAKPRRGNLTAGRFAAYHLPGYGECSPDRHRFNSSASSTYKKDGVIFETHFNDTEIKWRNDWSVWGVGFMGYDTFQVGVVSVSLMSVFRIAGCRGGGRGGGSLVQRPSLFSGPRFTSGNFEAEHTYAIFDFHYVRMGIGHDILISHPWKNFQQDMRRCLLAMSVTRHVRSVESLLPGRIQNALACPVYSVTCFSLVQWSSSMQCSGRLLRSSCDRTFRECSVILSLNFHDYKRCYRTRTKRGEPRRHRIAHRHGLQATPHRAAGGIRRVDAGLGHAGDNVWRKG